MRRETGNKKNGQQLLRWLFILLGLLIGAICAVLISLGITEAVDYFTHGASGEAIYNTEPFRWNRFWIDQPSTMLKTVTAGFFLILFTLVGGFIAEVAKEKPEHVSLEVAGLILKEGAEHTTSEISSDNLKGGAEDTTFEKLSDNLKGSAEDTRSEKLSDNYHGNISPKQGEQKGSFKQSNELLPDASWRFLICWGAFASLFVFFAGNIAAGLVEIYVANNFEKFGAFRTEVRFVTGPGEPRDDEHSIYTKLGWHYFFNGGRLCQTERCEGKKLHSEVAKACMPENIMATEDQKDADQMNGDQRKIEGGGTEFSYRKDDEVSKEMAQMISVVSMCALGAAPKTSVTAEPLFLVVRNSGIGWSQCPAAESQSLNSALVELRSKKIEDLFEGSKRRAKEKYAEDFKRLAEESEAGGSSIPSIDGFSKYVDNLKLIRKQADELIDYIEPDYAKLFTKKTSPDRAAVNNRNELLSGVWAPTDFSESASIIFQHPMGCKNPYFYDGIPDGNSEVRDED